MSLERDVFSDQSFAVQLTLDRSREHARIRQVLIGGRPAGVFGLSPKSHLVPWLSMCDGLRADLAGQNLHTALERLRELCDWTANLPSERLAEGLRGQPLPRRGARKTPAVPGTPAWWHARAAEHVGAARAAADEYTDLADADDPDEHRLVPLVQNLAAAYLHFRNTAPLSAAQVRNPAGPPVKAAASVRGSERWLSSRSLSRKEREDLAADLWSLLDLRALDALKTDPAQLLDPEWSEHLGAYVLTDHVRSMEHAYPRSAGETDLAATLSTRLNAAEMRTARECLSMSRTAPPSAEGRENAAVQDEAGVPVDEDDETGDVYERFAVQFAMEDDGTIERVYVGARPRAAHGRHVTAWVVLCDYVRAVVDGAALDDVAGRVAAARRDLGGIAEVMGRPGIPAAGDTGTSTQVAAQACVAAFLTDLNELDGAITDTGGTSPGATEGDRRKRLLAGDASVLDVAGMLDPKCLAWAPRGNASSHAYRVALHLRMAGVAYGIRVLRRAGDEDELVRLVGVDTFAALLAPAELDTVTMNRVNALVLKALDPETPYDDAAYVKAVDRFSSDRRRREVAGDDADYRESQDSDDGADH